jgi:hypothetical protein
MPLAIFVIGKKVTFDNYGQIKAIIGRYAKASTALQDFLPEQIAKAYLAAESQCKGEYDVTLETVGKKILEYKDSSFTGGMAIKLTELLTLYEKQKDLILSSSSPLIHEAAAV